MVSREHSLLAWRTMISDQYTVKVFGLCTIESGSVNGVRRTWPHFQHFCQSFQLHKPLRSVPIFAAMSSLL